MKYLVLITLCSVAVSVLADNRLKSFSTVDDYMNVCIDSPTHKKSPGPESSLFRLCSPYKDWSCCTEETSQKSHTNATWHQFNWDHCGRLSDRCRAHFQRDLCFYECSPNVGPWLVQEDRTWRNERFQDAPLCKTDCDSWFNDCKDDMACVMNWSQDFNWNRGVQQCPSDSPCRKFSEVYNSAQQFCENVWDHSWKVVPDSVPCMRIIFESYDMANNEMVARQKAEEILASESRDMHTASGAVVADFSKHLLCLIAAILYAAY